MLLQFCIVWSTVTILLGNSMSDDFFYETQGSFLVKEKTTEDLRSDATFLRRGKIGHFWSERGENGQKRGHRSHGRKRVTEGSRGARTLDPRKPVVQSSHRGLLVARMPLRYSAKNNPTPKSGARKRNKPRNLGKLNFFIAEPEPATTFDSEVRISRPRSPHIRIPSNHNPVYTGITDHRQIDDKYKLFREQYSIPENEKFDYGINEYPMVKKKYSGEGEQDE